jgi:predicted CoA-substrate-specific enzyme activase
MNGEAGGLVLGVDVGSTTWKAVAVDPAGNIVARHVEPTEARIEPQTERALGELREKCGSGPDIPLGATGYGRKRVPGATRALTEITCHARGAFHLIHRAGVLIDFGGQDTKIIRFGANGEVQDFAMNDKCAAGTGRFLEVILGRLEVAPEDAPQLVAQAHQGVRISSTCTVFAESEVVSLVAQGEPVPEIVMGLHSALASRVAALAGRVGEGEMIFMSGGVALNQAMADALVVALRRPVEVLPDPQLVGALGAALAVRPPRP